MTSKLGKIRRRRRRWAAEHIDKKTACIDKRSLGYRAAHRTARILRDEGDHVHAYPCPHGAHWHVGHTAYEDLAW